MRLPPQPLELDFASEAYAFAMIDRIQPYLGVDNPWTFFNRIKDGREPSWTWHWLLSIYFPRWYRYHMVSALLQKAPLDHWLIDLGHANPWGGNHYIGGLVETLSFVEAVAFLHGQSKGTRVKPSQVHWDHSLRTLNVFGNHKCRATISPLSTTHVHEVQRDRGDGTVQGLSKAVKLQDELRRRLSNWPGAAWINDAEFFGDSSTSLASNIPCRQDWLIRSKLLIERAGFVKPDLANAQGLTCAVFGATDWDRLCGAMNRNSELGIRPVVVQTLRSDLTRESYAIYPDYGSAVGDWVRSATALRSEFPESFISYDSNDRQATSLTLSHGTRGIRSSYRSAVMHPIGLGFAKPRARSEVVRLGLDPSHAGVGSSLQRLFCPRL